MTDHPLPIQLFYSGEVFRHERAGAGKQKEFYQIGLESMGTAGLWADVEAILIAVDCLRQLGVSGFRVALGHVGVFSGIASSLGLQPEEADALREAIDRKDCAWLEREVTRFDLPEAKKLFLAQLPNYAGGREVLDAALAVVENTRARHALMDLTGIHDVFASLGLAEVVTFDLAEVRGLDYYSGILFKIYGPLHGFEVGGGGRYDGLAGKFGWDIPAVGFSFTLDRLLPLIRDVDGLSLPQHGPGEHVLAADGVPLPELFSRAWELRGQGARIRMGRDRQC
jgi:ATP phosphoribosyltransferase regulatory subunit